MKQRSVGTTSRGIRCPIIRQGDDLVQIVCNSVIEASKNEGFDLHDKDVVAITESVVARSQGNYASVDAIKKDLETKFNREPFGVIFPILSRNRFAIMLKAFAMATNKIYLMLSYPSDEVGNHLISIDQVDEANINPYSDVLTLAEYRKSPRSYFRESPIHY